MYVINQQIEPDTVEKYQKFKMSLKMNLKHNKNNKKERPMSHKSNQMSDPNISMHNEEINILNDQNVYGSSQENRLTW